MRAGLWRRVSWAGVTLGAVSGVVFGLPLAWIAGTALAAATDDLGGGPYRWALLARTLMYCIAAGLLATALGFPVARVLGRRAEGTLRRGSRALLMAAVPATLIIPSMVFAYGGQQALRLAGIGLDPASPADVLRCIVTLATWLWGLPAALIALAWWRLDPWVMQQARLDGVPRRMTARLLAAPLVASICVTSAIATQEFGVFETTGISVSATEVRTVFDTGAFLGGAAGVGGGDQSRRAAGAVAVGLPALVATFVLFAAGLLLAWRLVLPPATGDAATPPRESTPWSAHVLAWAVVTWVLGVPVAALAASLADPAPPWTWLATFRPQVGGTLLMGTLGFAAAAALATLGSLTRPWWALGLGMTTFLLGGLMVGIALTRLYNRPATSWVYDSPTVTVLAYLARFGWVALLAAAVAHAPGVLRLRELAATDGAGRWGTFVRVVLPGVWPVLLAGAAGVGLLAMGEVPATMLVAPPSPELLTPLLMTWVHMQRYDPMIQAGLLLVAVSVIAASVGLLGWALLRRTRGT